MTEARVLIVDDDPVVRETLALAFEDENWDLVAVASADEAMETWQAGEWATLVVDRNLPGMSGIDFIRAVREQDQVVGILMITGGSMVETALDALHLGVDGYLEKPFDDIFAVVRDVRDVIATQERRRRAGSMAGAVSHFARASLHLQTIQRDCSLRVLLGTDAETAAWIRERLGDAEIEVVASRDEVLARVREAWDLVFLDADMAGGDPVAWVREVRDVAGDVACVLVTFRPTLKVVTQLIRLRVGAVLEQPLSDRQFEQRITPMLVGLRNQESTRGGRP